MHIPHPQFGDLVTANRLVRDGRWVFRGTIIPLEDVLADLSAGMTVEEIWEKHGTLDWNDLHAVARRLEVKTPDGTRHATGHRMLRT